MQDSDTEETPRAWLTILLQRTHILQQIHPFTRYLSEWFLNASFSISTPVVTQKLNVSIPTRFRYLATKALGWLLALYVIIQLYYGIQYIDWHKSMYVFFLGGITALRVLTVVLFSSIVWVPIGVWIGLRPRLTAITQPVIQFLAAFPANVLFPLVVLFILKFKLSFEFGVLPLMLLGSQWYILFNVIAGVSAIPKELYQVAENLGVHGWLWWKRLILPGIFPYLMTGIMTAVGAAWNISVVAEVIQWGPTVLKVTGLGAYIDQASAQGSFPQVAMGIAMMSLWVLTMNYLIWQPLYRLAQSNYRLN